MTLWVKSDIFGIPADVRFTPESGHGADTRRCPLCANNRHSLVQQDLQLLDHPIGAAEQWQRDGEAKRPRSLEIDDQLDFRGLLYRQIARLFAI